MKSFFDKHEWFYRAMRTFLQAAIGVVAAAIASVSGVVDDINWQAVIVLAVSTGAAALMNAQGKDDSEGT